MTSDRRLYTQATILSGSSHAKDIQIDLSIEIARTAVARAENQRILRTTSLQTKAWTLKDYEGSTAMHLSWLPFEPDVIHELVANPEIAEIEVYELAHM